MKLSNKNVKIIIATIIGTIIGMLITGGIVFATVQYNASEVRYDTTTVAGALDNLYNYSKNKSDLAEKMQKPNTWEVGVEQNFGDGVYGKRFTGTITASAKEPKDVALDPIENLKVIISIGGSWIRNNDGSITHITTNFTTNYSTILHVSDTDLRLRTLASASRTNAPYDIWILYTK